MANANAAAANRRNRIRSDSSTMAIRVLAYIFISILALCCLVPFLLILGTSFSSEASVMKYGFTLWPHEFSLKAYELVFAQPDIIIGDYILTIVLTLAGTALGLFLIAMAGYVLQRPDFDFRNGISFYIYFTTLFSGGMVPTYIMMTNVLKLKDNYLAVFLPLLMSPWLLILMKNFMKSIPFAVTESAKIDGAGDFRIFVSIVLPMAKPALATVGLFLALSYWNEWYNSMLYLGNMRYKPLQYFLYKTVNEAQYIRSSAAAANIPTKEVPLETMKMSCAIVTIGPVILLYPFVQKYFIKGITVGAVKG